MDVSRVKRDHRPRADSYRKARSFLAPNKHLLPLKFTLFFFNGATYALQPYLTIHMKDLGINDVDIALMYAILPFCVFIAPPIVGFFADKLGNYVRVLLLSIVSCAIFHSLLLGVPSNLHKVKYPDTNLTMVGQDVNLTWDLCPTQNPNEKAACTHIRNPEEQDQDPIPIYFALYNCTYDCESSEFKLDNLFREYKFLGIPLTTEDVICNHIGRKHCKVWPGMRKMEFIRVNTNVSGNMACGRAHIDFYTDSDPCITNNIEDEKPLGIMDSCFMQCKVRTNLIANCKEYEQGNRLITNGVYFIFRMLATMALASCFILLDAQTIRMCELEEKQGADGAYGRQILYKTLAQAVISPSVGAIMDYISAQQGKPDYIAPFLIGDFLLFITFICAYKIDMNLDLPQNTDSIKGMKAILGNMEIMLFLFMMFVCGTMYGFVETFLFVFLKEDLHAPIFLLGLTITTGAAVSIPFLYYSDAIVKKIGCDKVICLALFMYAVRYVGYSFVYCAWFAFPFEALEVFTYFFLQVGAAEFIKVNAPLGMLATFTGLEGGFHHGFGKGVGGLVGGILIEYTKSTHRAFWYFGIAAFTMSVVYASFVSLFIAKKKVNKSGAKKEQTEGETHENGRVTKKEGEDDDAIEIQAFKEKVKEARKDSADGTETESFIETVQVDEGVRRPSKVSIRRLSREPERRMSIVIEREAAQSN